MKCDMYARWTLRESSAELDLVREFFLNRHCHRCSACAAFRDHLPAWSRPIRSALDIGSAGIEAAAELVRQAPLPTRRRSPLSGLSGESFLLRPYFRPVAIGAIVLLLAAGGLWFELQRQDTRTAQPPGAESLRLSDVDLWDLDADLLADQLALLTRDLQHMFPDEHGGLRDELDELAVELIQLEESA